MNGRQRQFERMCLALATVAFVAGAPVCAQAPAPGLQGDRGVAHPEIWPKYHWPVATDARAEAKIHDLLARMTVEEKIGQLVQGDIAFTTPDDVRKYHLGSVLAGGSSGPYGNDLAPAPQWLKLADEYWAASTDTSQGGVGIPSMWGIDAVHGHSNIIGATLFPHNIGLGAAHDPALIERIGAATATEIRVTGQEWTFAPTVTVPQDYRWGRAYEGYSSDPALVSAYVGAMVRGLQGPPAQTDLLAHDKVLASTKHFLADGGTTNGVDQGDANISEIELRDIHGAPYGPAIENGVGTVMASFSSWQGRKMTGNASLLTGVLKQRMGFGGFVVSDWNAHGQVEGCTNAACPQALLAGLDMYMAPDTWKSVWENLVAETRAGHIPMARVDDAVARILRVKFRLGLFDAPRPSARALSGQWALLGAPEHRAIAREAVRESLVLLKNNGVLPLKPGMRLLVAGDAADDIARQSGGWTLSWQGTGLNNTMFPGATSLWKGLSDAAGAAGGTAELSPDGHFTKRPDAAVVVFGEKPYAEFQGDRGSLQLDADLTAPWATMRQLKAAGIPVVAVMLTGRPLYVNPALNLADAFVVAWLPGSEGEGLSDVLFADKHGQPRFDFTGKLPAAWPRAAQIADGVLYPRGYGLTYHSGDRNWAPLAELAAAKGGGDARVWFANGIPASGWSLRVLGDTNETRITTVPAKALDGRMTVTATDFKVQEGARRFTVTGGNAHVVLDPPALIDLARETNGDALVLVTMRNFGPATTAALTMRCADKACGTPVTITLPAADHYIRYGVPLRCFATHGVDMHKISTAIAIGTSGAADYALGEIRIGSDAEQVLACP